MIGSDRQRRAAALALPLALYAFVVVQTAWLCDDAYITFRTVENFVAGLGLRWNPVERVQAYTHPLWMFVISGGVALTGRLYATALGVSIACSFAAVTGLAVRLARSPWSAAVAVLTLAASSAFVDYSTSGLESPLTHLLLVGFGLRYLDRPVDARNLVVLAGIASLAALNRPDSVLLYLPALAEATWRFGRWRGLALVAAGFTPLLAWEAFSLVYYGFAFPNTAYAKLKLFLPRDDLVAQGFRYLAHSLRTDPITPAAILAGGVLACVERARQGLAVFAGAALTLAYVVWIGGDFMAGRLLAAPLLACVVLIARSAWLARARGAGIGLAVVAGLAFLAPQPSFRSDGGTGIAYEDLIGPDGVADERRYYAPFTGLRFYAMHGGVPDHPWAAEGLAARREGKKLVLMQAAGFFGWAAGPDVHVVDPYGLSEPLLARLPPTSLPDWRIGHLARALPAGYWETLRDGTPQIEDPGIAAYQAALAEITRGPIWSRARWAAIGAMALGRYEARLPIQALRFPPTETRAPEALEGEALALDWRGLDVPFGERVHAPAIEIRASGDDGWSVVFFRGADDVARVTQAPLPAADAALRVLRFDVPAATAAGGYDRVRVQPFAGDGRYRVAGLTLR